MPNKPVNSVKLTEGVNRPKRSLRARISRWVLSLLAVLVVGLLVFLLYPS